jgi:hypothetical protein
MMAEKIYLGDSVYGTFEGERITLTTENGYGASNVIVFEPEVLAAFCAWIQSIQKRAADAAIVNWVEQRKQSER